MMLYRATCARYRTDEKVIKQVQVDMQNARTASQYSAQVQPSSPTASPPNILQAPPHPMASYPYNSSPPPQAPHIPGNGAYPGFPVSPAPYGQSPYGQPNYPPANYPSALQYQQPPPQHPSQWQSPSNYAPFYPPQSYPPPQNLNYPQHTSNIQENSTGPGQGHIKAE